MTIVVGSVFRNSASYVDRYFSQIRNLRMQTLPDIKMKLLLVEGDSKDDTWARLNHWRDMDILPNTSIELIKREHGGPDYGRIDDPKRWGQIAYACNGIMENMPDDTSVFMYVESDLIWSAHDVNRLIDGLYGIFQCDAVAPMCRWLRNGDFYDTWGFRAEGANFSPKHPYHPSIGSQSYFRLESAGSMVAMKKKVAERARFSEEDCIVGLCRNMRELGYDLWLNQNITIWHPDDDRG